MREDLIERAELQVHNSFQAFSTKKENKMNKDAYITKGINISTTTILGNSYIYIENRREIMKLNEVGSYIWGNINGTSTISEVIKKCQEVISDN